VTLESVTPGTGAGDRPLVALILPERPRLRYEATTSEAAQRPTLRGVIHRYGACAFALAFAGLCISAPDGAARVWIAVYGLCVTGMLGVSAIYHSGRLSPRGQRTFKRVDHAMILLAIAGSYTGVFGLGVSGTPRTVVLILVWVAAVIGIGLRMLWLNAPYPLVAIVYVTVGWIALIEVGPLLDALSGVEALLVLIGGVLYTMGGIVYALHRPNPWPKTFGYHEVFHTLVVLAAGCHFAVAVSIVRTRRG
jgi:hemolysin III